MTNIILSLLVSLSLAVASYAAEPPSLSPASETVRSETFTYKKTPQGELAIHVSYPKDWKAADKRPAIIFFFGGGWTGGTVRQFAPQAAYLAGRGMVAARADYRVRSRHKTSPLECVEDGKSAVRWLRANAAKLGIDPDRICASGGSAGGHIAACTATVEGFSAEGDDTKVSARPNLLILYNPVLDLSSPGIGERAGSAAKARQISPNEHLTKDVPPAIMYYGAQDRFLEHTKAYLKKAAQLGLKADVYVAAGAGHGFFNRPPWLQRTTHLTDEFLTKHGYLKGKPTVELPEGKVAMEKLSVEGGK